MHAALDAASWVSYGLELLLEVAGVVLAVVHRKAHPTTARLAAAGLLCVLAHHVLSNVVAWVYASLMRPGPNGASLGRDYAVIELAEHLTHYLLNLVGAAGWTLVLIALFATHVRSPAPAATATEGAHPWSPSSS